MILWLRNQLIRLKGYIKREFSGRHFKFWLAVGLVKLIILILLVVFLVKVVKV